MVLRTYWHCSLIDEISLDLERNQNKNISYANTIHKSSFAAPDVLQISTSLYLFNPLNYLSARQYTLTPHIKCVPVILL